MTASTFADEPNFSPHHVLAGTETSTGFTDFVDPIDSVHDVARHPPHSVIMLTDLMDAVVTASSQGAYLTALRDAGVHVEQHYVTARDAAYYLLRIPAILAALACP